MGGIFFFFNVRAFLDDDSISLLYSVPLRILLKSNKKISLLYYFLASKNPLVRIFGRKAASYTILKRDSKQRFRLPFVNQQKISIMSQKRKSKLSFRVLFDGRVTCCLRPKIRALVCFCQRILK
jgi:hypothetical protein